MIRIERSVEAPVGIMRRLAKLATVLVLMTVVAGCSGNAKDKLASLASSLSNQPSGVPTSLPSISRPPVTRSPTTEAPTTETPSTEAPTTETPTTEAPTTEAPTTEAPTTEAPTTQAPTTEAPTTEAPTTSAPTEAGSSGSSPSPTAATTSSGVSPWVWVVLALLLLFGLLALAARRRGQAQAVARASSVKALDAYSVGVALHDRIEAELVSAPGDGPLVSAANVSEAQRMMDGLAASVAALTLEAPQDTIKAAAGHVALGITGLRSALQLATTTGPASEDRVQVAATLRDRLQDFTGSLGELRDAARGQPPQTTS